MAQSNDETAIEGLLNLQHNDKNQHVSASNQETGKETNETTEHIVSMTPGDTSTTKNMPALQDKSKNEVNINNTTNKTTQESSDQDQYKEGKAKKLADEETTTVSASTRSTSNQFESTNQKSTNPTEQHEESKQSEKRDPDTTVIVQDSTTSSVNVSKTIAKSSDADKIHNVYASDQRGMLNWNVAIFQYFMKPNSNIRNMIMGTFLSAIKINYPEALFCDDKYQMQPTTETFDYVNINKETVAVKTRKEFYRSIDKVCRLMEVKDKSTEGSHYQVLVLEKDIKEITLIEHTMYGDLSTAQIAGIKEVIQSYGWGLKKTLSFVKSKGRGNNGDIIKKKRTWYFNHVSYKVADKTESRISSPSLDRFACLVLLKIMSNIEQDFEPASMSFDEFDNQDMQGHFIKKLRVLLPKYIDNEMRIQNITSENNRSSYKQCVFTKKLLALSDVKWEFAIDPPNGVNCPCGKGHNRTGIYFTPSCCFRSYHYGCYMKDFMAQLNTNEGIFYCFHCRQKHNVTLGIQKNNVIAGNHIYEMTDEMNMFKQFLSFTTLDKWHT